jgi:hypothetical protein
MTSELGCQSQLQTIIEATQINADFMFGVKDINGEVNFAANNYQNWYDTCSRTVTFVDMSQVLNSKKDGILWEILGTNARSRDSLFTYTFPEPNTPTTYLVRLTVFAENGCADTSNSANHYITIYPSPRVKIGGNTIFCEGKTICLKPTTIRSSFILHHWSWKKNTGETGSIIGDSLLINSAGMYCLMSLDTNGCIAYDTLIITPLKPEIQNLSITHINCWGDGAVGSFSHGNITGSSGGFQAARWRIWDNAIGDFRDEDIISRLGQSIIFRNQIGGNYYFFAIDDNGCEFRDTITIQQPDSLYFIATVKEATGSENNGEIAFVVIGGTPPYNISVENTNTHRIHTPSNPTKDTITRLPTGTYIAKLVDSHNCTASADTIIVSVSSTGVAGANGILSEIRVYPNPANTELRIHLPNPSERGAYMENIEIYNVMGQKLLAPFNSPEGGKLPSFGGAGGGEIVIDISHLAKGMYFLKVGNTVVRFVKE